MEAVVGRIEREVGCVTFPKHWEVLTLGQAFRWSSGGTPKSGDAEYYGGNIPWVVIGDLNESYLHQTANSITEAGLQNSSAKWVEPGAVLLAMYGSIGKSAIAGCRLTTNQAIAFTEPLDETDGKYLFYYLKANQSRLAKLGKGATQLNISQTVIKAFPFVRASRPEREFIVSRIDELLSDLDAGVANLERAQANLKSYRATILKAAVDGRLTEEWRKQNPHIETGEQFLARILKARRAKWEADQLEKFAKQGKPRPDGWQSKYIEPSALNITGLPKLPERWCWATLSQLGTLDRGKSKHRPRNDPYLFGGVYPFIQTGEIRQANVYVKSFTQTYSDAGLAQSRLWPAETLCITIAANIAESAILTFEACFPDSIVGFIPALSELPVQYVHAYIRSVRKHLEALAPATAQKNINLETLHGLAISVPPATELQEIIRELERVESVIDASEAEITRQLTRAARLRQSILKAAFSGKLLEESSQNQMANEATA